MRRALTAFVLMATCAAYAGKEPKVRREDSLETYLARVRSAPVAAAVERIPGSLWIDSGLLSDSISDHRARAVGDVIMVQVIELTSAQTSAAVNTQRQFSASSGINALGGKINTSGIDTLFSPSSAQNLKGQGVASADSKLQTALSGRIVAVLSSGALVLEAQREVVINDQKNRVIVRGVARPVDITADDSIVSTKLSDLEVELVGKGVVSDGSRQPNIVVRWLLRLLNF